MKILITGSKGKLGRHFLRTLSASHEAIGVDQDTMDIAEFNEILPLAMSFKPDVILNAAAYTAVDKAEDEPEAAYRANALAVRNLAIAANQACARLVHFSTDFVFDGSRNGPPYMEYDQPNPMSVYGKSKYAGEREALEICRNSLVLRLSWLYGKGGWNFTDWVIEEVSAGRTIRIVTDQVGCPTSIPDVARQVAFLLDTQAAGLYHCSGKGNCSRYEWACEALRIAGLDAALAMPVSSYEFVQKAPRPAYSALDNFCLNSQGLEIMLPWQEALREYLSGKHD